MIKGERVAAETRRRAVANMKGRKYMHWMNTVLPSTRRKAAPKYM